MSTKLSLQLNKTAQKYALIKERNKKLRIHKSKETEKLNQQLRVQRSQTFQNNAQKNLKESQRIKHSKEIKESLPLALLALDSYLTSSKKLRNRELNDFLLTQILHKQDNPENPQLKDLYSEFLTRFIDFGKIEENVIYCAWVLNKKIVQKIKESLTVSFSNGENFLVFSACLYLSIKMLNDMEKWFIEDFAQVSGLEERVIEKMEIRILRDILDFDLHVDYKYVQKERILIESIGPMLLRNEEKKLKRSFTLKSSLKGSFNKVVFDEKIYKRKRGFSIKKLKRSFAGLC